jgi:hypothetical protein
MRSTLPCNMKLLTRARHPQNGVNDFISMLMFEPHYVSTLIEIGERDVVAPVDELRAFLGDRQRRSAV